jgi:hypothetical protein
MVFFLPNLDSLFTLFKFFFAQFRFSFHFATGCLPFACQSVHIWTHPTSLAFLHLILYTAELITSFASSRRVVVVHVQHRSDAQCWGPDLLRGQGQCKTDLAALMSWKSSCPTRENFKPHHDPPNDKIITRTNPAAAKPVALIGCWFAGGKQLHTRPIILRPPP